MTEYQGGALPYSQSFRGNFRFLAQRLNLRRSPGAPKLQEGVLWMIGSMNQFHRLPRDIVPGEAGIEKRRVFSDFQNTLRVLRVSA
jgi:hypothetical protein